MADGLVWVQVGGQKLRVGSSFAETHELDEVDPPLGKGGATSGVDTGWRDISLLAGFADAYNQVHAPGAAAAWKTANPNYQLLAVRRRGTRVFLDIDRSLTDGSMGEVLDDSAGYAGAAEILAWSGFGVGGLAGSQVMIPVCGDENKLTGHVNLHDNVFTVRDLDGANAWPVPINCRIEWDTDDDWPTTLPGVAVP